MTVHFRIVGTNLPGARFEQHEPVYVGVQRDRDVVARVRGDEREAVFEFDVDVRRGRFAGPYVHGRGDERFVYLSWGEVTGDEFAMFRRAKLQLDAFDAEACDGKSVTGTLALTDANGGPVCASVRPPRIAWAVE